MKNIRKLLCAFLAVATVVCFMPVMAFADTPYTVTLMPGEGTGKQQTIENVPAGQYTIPECPSGFTAPEGKKFDGWVLENKGGGITGGSTTGGSTTGGSTTGGSTTGGSTTGGSTTGGSTTGGSTTGGSTGSALGGDTDQTVIVKPGDSYNIKSDITLTAQWKNIEVVHGGGGYIPAAPVDSLAAARKDAAAAVDTAAAAEKYEETEQAQVNAIVEKAKKEIEAAKTAEEIKAAEAAAKEAIAAVDTAAEKAEIRAIEAIGRDVFKAKSTRTTLNGKRAVRVTWNKPAGVELDGYEIFRSTERYKGFGTEPFFTTANQKYTNNKALKTGKTYYYKVRGFKVVNGRTIYTGYSTKAWRTIK